MADFEQPREESSLSLRERVEEFLENLSFKWQEFLNWSDEKGLPLRKINDFFEEKGIPALPAICVLLLLLSGGVYIAFLSLSQPVSKTFGVTVRDAEGNPIVGAAVQLQFSTGEELQTKTVNTDENGRVVFENIPSTTATIAVNAPDFEPGSRQVNVEEGQDSKTVSLSLTRIDNPHATLTVTITGPPAADVALLSSNSSLIETQNSTSLAQFQVLPNSNYTIIARAAGYRDELKIVQVATANLNIPLRLFREGEARTAPVYARVYTGNGVTPVANATVRILTEATGTQLASSVTGEDGAAPAMEIQVGANVSVTVTKEGFLTWFLPSLTVNEPEASIVANLVARTADNSKNIVITVIDEAGHSLPEPHVALYCGDAVEIRDPENGIAGFDVAIGKTCLASVSKEGYLPAQVQLTSATEQSIVLQTATSGNSGAVVVETVDKNGNTIAGIDVSPSINAKPLGISKQTQVDGTARFEHLPLANITFTASSVDLQGEASLVVQPSETTSEAQKLQVRLSPAKSRVDVTVIDHFARNPIVNALVSITDTSGNAVACTAVNGSCFLLVEIGTTVSASITAPGFELLLARFDVSPGNNRQEFELISSDVAEGTALVFVGTFNENNQRVSVLSPASRYTVKYLLKAPLAINFSTAKAFVQVGEVDVDIESGSAVITSFSSLGERAIGGIDYSLSDSFEPTTVAGSLTLVQEDERRLAPTQVLANGDLSALSSTSGTSAALASGRFKWVEFTFDSFQGTRELKINIETAPVQEANVELFHRTEYNVLLANGSSETLRDPIDVEAGLSKAPLLAALAEPNVVPIRFEGKCTENTCIELWFEGSTGRQTAFQPFEAVVPETFKLSYRLLVPPVSPLRGGDSRITLSLQTDSDAIAIDGNASSATRQANIGQEGFFTLKAVKYSNDVPLSLSATGGASFEEELHVSVSNAGNQIKVQPSLFKLSAFENNNLAFTVTDNYGSPLQARVVVERGSSLASSVEAQEEAAGKYVVEITPSSFGQVTYTVQAQGFRTKKGKIPVIAKNIVSMEPASGIAVSIDSTEPSEGSSFTVTNLIPDKEVAVSLSPLPDTAPKYSTITLSETAFKLKGGQTKSISIVGRIRSDVITFSPKPTQLRENYNGKISVNARVVGFTQSSNVGFAASVAFQQQQFDQLIDYSTDSLSFSLDLPRKRRDSTSIRVTNNADKPILVNQQSSLPGVFVTPVSAVIPPEGFAEFNATATPSPLFLREQCVFEDYAEKGSVEFTAGFQGITSSKTIEVDVQTTSRQRCIVPGALSVILPMDINFVFPPGTIANKNGAFDGSQAVRLPNGELVVFNQGSQVTDQRAYVPAGSAIELSPQYINAPSSDEFQVRFPFHATLAIPYGSQQSTLSDGSIKLSTQAADIILPAGLQRGFQGGTAFASPSDPYSGFRSLGDYQRFGSFFGTTSSYALSAFTSIKIVATRVTSGEPFEITYEEEVFLELPANAQAQQSGSSVTAALSNCVQLQVYSRTNQAQQIRDVLPSARQVEITQATLTGRSVKISPGGKITVQTCLGANEEAKLFQTRLRAPVTFVVPPGTPDPRSTGMDVSYPNCAELVYKSGYSLGVSLVKKIRLPQSANVKQPLENGAREIEVANQETILLAPCRSTTPSVSTFAGLGIEARPDSGAIEFTFTEVDIGKTRTSGTLCLVNRRKGIVSPAGSSGTYIASVIGNLAQEAGFALQPVKTHTSLDLSPSPRGECNNQFKLIATIPASAHDGKCITNPVDAVEGSIAFTARDSTGWTGSTSLPVKITVKPGKACQRDHEKAASEMLKLFYVDYSKNNVNERTGQPFVFTFKGTGSEHSRVLSLLNNFESSLSIQASGANSLLLACNFPTSIQAGDAVAVACTPRAFTNGIEQLKITATSGQYTFDTIVNIQVHNGNADIYKNSPWGELAPSSATTAQRLSSHAFVSFATDDSVGQTRELASDSATSAGTGFMGECAKHYCTYKQAQAAFDNFVVELSRIAKEKTASREVQEALCAPGGGAGNYKKSMLLHLANTKQDFATYINTPSVAATIPYEVTNVPSLVGCGVYKISARLDLCSATSLGTAGENNVKVQVFEAQKLAECPRNVANAPLFLGSKEEDLNIYLGRELGVSFNKPQSISDAIGILSLGPYTNGVNKDDDATSRAILKTIYGDSIPVLQATLPEHYDHNAFCIKRGLEQIGIVSGAGAAVSGALALSGVGAGFAARLMYGVTQAGLACGLSAVGQGISTALPGEQSFACPTMNACIRSAIFGAISSVAPVGGSTALKTAGQGFKAALPSKGGAVTYALLTTGATFGAEAYNAYNGEKPDVPPGLAGPAAFSTTRTLAAGVSRDKLQLPNFEAQFKTARADPAVAAVLTDDANGKNLFAKLLTADTNNPGQGILHVSEVSGVSGATKQALQHQLNLLSGDVKVIKASAIATTLRDSLIADDAIVDEVYNKLRITSGGDAKLARTAREVVAAKLGGAVRVSTLDSAMHDAFKRDAAAARLTSVDEMREELFKRVEESSKKGAKGVAKVPRGSITRFGKSLLPAVGQLALQLALDVDVRPTESRIPVNAKNVLVIYHVENPFTAPMLPSIHKFCLQDASGQCSDKSFFLANACNSDKDVCILSYDAGVSGTDSYMLLVAVNNKQVKQRELFDSLMFPQAPILDLTGKYTFGSLSQGDVTFSQQNEADTGDETALKRNPTQAVSIVTIGGTSG